MLSLGLLRAIRAGLPFEFPWLVLANYVITSESLRTPMRAFLRRSPKLTIIVTAERLSSVEGVAFTNVIAASAKDAHPRILQKSLTWRPSEKPCIVMFID